MKRFKKILSHKQAALSIFYSTKEDLANVVLRFQAAKADIDSGILRKKAEIEEEYAAAAFADQEITEANGTIEKINHILGS